MIGKIVDNLSLYEDREEPVKIKKYKENKINHLTKIKKEVDYQYYTCDYCKQEIKIEKDIEKKTGGICTIPSSLTGRGKIKLALHNRCLNPVIEQFEKRREEKRKC